MSLALYSKHYSLSGRAIVVLGGAGTTGTAIAEAIARAGADLIIGGRSEARGHACVERVRSCGGVGGYHPADLREPASIEVLIDYALGEYGKVDGLLQVASSCWESHWMTVAATVFQTTMQQQPDGGVVLNVAPDVWAGSVANGAPANAAKVGKAFHVPVHTVWTPSGRESPCPSPPDASPAAPGSSRHDALHSTETLKTITALALTLLRHGRDVQGGEMFVTSPPQPAS